MQINVRTNIDEVLKRLENYRQAVVQEAIPLALNRTAEMVATQTARVMATNKAMGGVRKIRDSMSIVKATRSRLVATIKVKRTPRPLIEFGARQTRQGVLVRDGAGPAKLVKGAFIATMPSGHKGVYVSTPGAVHKKVKKNGKTQWHSLPIRELFGPSIGGAYGADPRVQAFIKLDAPAIFSKRLEHEIKRIAARLG